MQILGLKGLSTYKAVQAAHMYFDFIRVVIKSRGPGIFPSY